MLQLCQKMDQMIQGQDQMIQEYLRKEVPAQPTQGDHHAPFQIHHPEMFAFFVKSRAISNQHALN